jgi:TonB family protein
MHIAKLLPCVLLAAAFLTLPTLAQDSLEVDQAELAKHVNHRVPPVYPPIAKAARIQGEVVFQVNVSTAGHVESLKVLNGPAMLQQAAMDCLRQWTYRPFLKDGTPVPATGKASIFFSLGDSPEALRKDQEIADRYFKLDDQCHKAVLSHSDPAAAESVCNQVANIATEFAPHARFIEKRSAYVYAATACANNRDLSQARKWADLALEVVKLGHDDNSGNNAVYSTLGFIEAMQGELAAADRDLTIAEDFGRKAIAWAKAENFEHGNSYIQSMIRDLRFHAQVLTAQGHSEQAQQKLDEAAKLQ